MHTALVWLNGKAVHGSLILLIFREFSKIFLASAPFRFWLRRHQVSDACKYTNQNIKMSCQSNKLHSHCLATSLHSSSFDCNYILNWKANQVNTSLPSLLKHGWKRHQTHSGPIYTPSDFFSYLYFNFLFPLLLIFVPQFLWLDDKGSNSIFNRAY